MANNNKKILPNVPTLRFPEFSGEWKKCKLKEYAKKITQKNKTNSIKNVLCNSANLGLIAQNEYFYRDITNSDNTNGYYVIKNCDFVYNPRKSTAAPYGPVNVYEGSNEGIISPLYLCFSIKNILPKFLFYRFKSSVWHSYVYSHGDTGVRFDRVSIKDDVFFDMPISSPSMEEQQKIAYMLSLIDERIATQGKIIEDLKKLKSAIRNKLFNQLLHSCNYLCTIRDILDYEQPTKYIVEDTEYSSDSFLVPVLTANKAFILGYTNERFGIYDKGECIIFDDFTMDVKFVDFDFKVKSSAIKILTAKNNADLIFIYEYLQYLELISEEHKRHYISEIEPTTICLPDNLTQHRISSILYGLDKRIIIMEKLCSHLGTQKKYLLQQMFI